MKKYLFILLLFSLVLMASGCTSTSNNKNFSADGISFQYPDTWNATSQVGNNSTQIMAADKDFIISNGTKGNVVLIIKSSSSNKNNISQTRQQIVNQAQKSGQMATNTTLNIAGLNASDISYTGNDTQGNTAYVRLIDFEKNSKIYIILLVSGGGIDVSNAKYYFNTIIQSFKVD